MNQHTDPPTESTQPGRLRWQVTVFQLLFGAPSGTSPLMATGLGSPTAVTHEA
jgi:hypothetical protein